MKKMIPVLLALFFSITSCSKDSDETHTAHASTQNKPTAKASPTVPAIIHSQDDWTKHEVSSTDGAIKLETAEMSKDEAYSWERKYKQTNLVPIPTNQAHNVSLFEIKNVDEYKDSVFVAPKLVFYSNGGQTRITSELNDNGTVTLQFPVVLVDGLTSRIPALDSSAVVFLPDRALVHDLAGLQSEIDQQFGVHKNIRDLPGCPKQIIVKVDDSEFDITPNGFSGGDYCQPNIPIGLSLTLNSERAKYVLKNALPAGNFEVRVVYETRVSFLVASMSLEIDKRILYDDVRKELGVNLRTWASTDVVIAVKKAVSQESMKIEIQGDISEAMNQIAEQATQEFFKPLALEDKPEAGTCLGKMACLYFNNFNASAAQSFKVNWSQSSDAMTGQTYISWSKFTQPCNSCLNSPFQRGTFGP